MQSLIIKKKKKNFGEFSEFFKNAFEEIYEKNLSNYSTFLIKSYSSFENHPLYNRIKQLNSLIEMGTDTPLKQIKNVDDSLAIFYLGNWNFCDSLENIILLKNIMLINYHLKNI